MNKFISLPAIFIILSSCQFEPVNIFKQIPKKKYIREYHSNGRIKSVIRVVNDQKHGECKHYYDDGNLKGTANYIMNKREGEVIGYYRNGKVRSRVNYANNKKHGKTYGYFENGNLYQEEKYDSGNLEGVKKKYYKNGNLQMQNFFHLGQPSTELKEYDTYGRLIKNYPELEVKIKDISESHQICLLEISFSKKCRNVYIYYEELDRDKFLPKIRHPLEVIEGKAKLWIQYPLDTSLNKKIIGTMETRLGHTRVVTKSLKTISET